jgi:hypothetical protein
MNKKRRRIRTEEQELEDEEKKGMKENMGRWRIRGRR